LNFKSISVSTGALSGACAPFRLDLQEGDSRAERNIFGRIRA